MTFSRLHLERVAVPEHRDQLESLTWARVRWPIAAGSATHVRTSVGEADSITVPTYPLAAWIVQNWWSLLYELAPPSNSGNDGADVALDRVPWAWRSRHCLRIADSSLLLPDLRVFSAGPSVTWEVYADPDRLAGAGPQLQFLDSLVASAERDKAAAALGEVVSWTLAQLRSCELDEAATLRAMWDFIAKTPASAPDAEFCRAAGRIGLDPHDVDHWPPGLCEWLEAAPAGTLDQAFSVDLQSFTGDVSDLPGLDRALRELVARYAVGAGGGMRKEADAPGGPSSALAWQKGYERAAQLRHDAKLADDAPAADLAGVVFDGAGVPLRSSADLRTRAPVAALAGWAGGTIRLLARDRLAGRRAAERFALARGVHHALWACGQGPRLVSDAVDEDQRASRAFAAELLAPRAAVLRGVEQRRREMTVADAVAEVAAQYSVEDRVVEWQFWNALQGR